MAAGLEVNGVEIIKSRHTFKEAQLGPRGAAYGKDQRWKGSAAGCVVCCLFQRVRPASGHMEADEEDNVLPGVYKGDGATQEEGIQSRTGKKKVEMDTKSWWRWG